MLMRLLAMASRLLPFVKSRGVIKLVKLVLSKDEQSKLTAQEKKRYLMVTCIMRDLIFLQKHLVYIQRARKQGGVEHSAEACSIVFFLTTLLSKVHEARVFFKRNKILKEKETFAPQLKKALGVYDAFFDDPMKREIVAFVRDKIGFHYEYQDDIDPEIEQALDGLAQYQMWLSSSDSGNDIFSSSNDVLTGVLLSTMRKLGFQGDDREQLMNLWDAALEGARVTQHFCRAYLTSGFSITWTEEGEVELLVLTQEAIEVPMLCAR